MQNWLQSKKPHLPSTAAGRRHWLLPSGCLDSSPVYQLCHLQKFTSFICTNTFWIGRGRKKLFGQLHFVSSQLGCFPAVPSPLVRTRCIWGLGIPKGKMYFFIFFRKIHFQFGQKNPLIWTNTFCVQPVFINQLCHLHLGPNTFYNSDKHILHFGWICFAICTIYICIYTVRVFTICAMPLVRAGEAEARGPPRPCFPGRFLSPATMGISWGGRGIYEEGRGI